ncbi:hypothetical protein JYT18_00180 [Desulfocapsa sp. AH-315-J15]|nr:hypothetical protein [Desulfocapsa sp. AH-315-J15]
MAKWILLTTAVIGAIAVTAVLIGQIHESSRVEQMLTTLSEREAQSAGGRVDFSSFSKLPPPGCPLFPTCSEQWPQSDKSGEVTAIRCSAN